VKDKRRQTGSGVELRPNRAEQSVAADRGRLLAVVGGMAVREGGRASFAKVSAKGWEVA